MCLFHLVTPPWSTAQIKQLTGHIAKKLDSQTECPEAEVPAEPISKKPVRKKPVFGGNAGSSSQAFYWSKSLPGIP